MRTRLTHASAAHVKLDPLQGLRQAGSLSQCSSRRRGPQR